MFWGVGEVSDVKDRVVMFVRGLVQFDVILVICSRQVLGCFGVFFLLSFRFSFLFGAKFVFSQKRIMFCFWFAIRIWFSILVLVFSRCCRLFRDGDDEGFFLVGGGGYRVWGWGFYVIQKVLRQKLCFGFNQKNFRVFFRIGWVRGVFLGLKGNNFRCQRIGRGDILGLRGN